MIGGVGGGKGEGYRMCGSLKKLKGEEERDRERETETETERERERERGGGGGGGGREKGENLTQNVGDKGHGKCVEGMEEG